MVNFLKFGDHGIAGGQLYVDPALDRTSSGIRGIIGAHQIRGRRVGKIEKKPYYTPVVATVHFLNFLSGMERTSALDQIRRRSGGGRKPMEQTPRLDSDSNGLVTTPEHAPQRIDSLGFGRERFRRYLRKRRRKAFARRVGDGGRESETG